MLLTLEQIQPYLDRLKDVQGPLQWEILRDRPRIADGHLVLPESPGFGAELGDDLEARFPCIEGSWAESVTR